MGKKKAEEADAGADNVFQFLRPEEIPVGKKISDFEKLLLRHLHVAIGKHLSGEMLTESEDSMIAVCLKSFLPSTDGILDTAKQAQLASARRVVKLPVELPARAPAFWKDRDLNSRESVSEFIHRVYAQWIGRGLQRRHIASLDPALYKALSVFLTRHPDHPLRNHLPSKRRPTQILMHYLSKEYSDEELRRVGYAIDAKLRRKSRDDTL